MQLCHQVSMQFNCLGTFNPKMYENPMGIEIFNFHLFWRLFFQRNMTGEDYNWKEEEIKEKIWVKIYFKQERKT